MVMFATVLEVNCSNLLVKEFPNEQEVIVNTSWACRFNVGENVKIVYNGAMTASLPPQISARRIFKMNN